MEKRKENIYLPWNPGFDAYGQTARHYFPAKNDPLAQNICMCYEITDCGKQSFLSAIPDGCHDIIITDEKAYFSVSIDMPRLFDLGRNERILGIRFRPDSLFLPQDDLSQYMDTPAPLEALFPKSNFFAEEMLAAKDFAEQKNILHRFLLKNSDHESEKQRLTRYCTRLILEHKGNYPLEQLAEHTGYSQRYLHSLFKRHIGTAPKTFAKTIRMQTAAMLLQKDMPLCKIAAESGYADQSHMNRDFLQLAGCLPRELRQEKFLFSTEHIKTTKFI